jgi:2-aminoethylphosphonate-pyruvate transaminase
MQGSGMFAIESVISSTIPPGGKLLALINGAYGERLLPMSQRLNIDHTALTYPDHQPIEPGAVAARLAADPGITHVAIVHWETTSGIINPIEAIGAVVQEAGKVYIVDAMISFGGTALDIPAAGIDYLISSANKCIEALPGFAFVLARLATLRQTEGYARSLVLDLFEQWQTLEQTNQFRFTPPIQVLLACHQALLELEAEGGIAARAARYHRMHALLVSEMERLGFQTYLPPYLQCPVVIAFRYPDHPAFDFATFYERVHQKGYVVYPGKVANTFRIGTMGHVFEPEVRGLIAAIQETIQEIES